MRIVSFLPSATEMAYELGLGDQVVGVTHECDYPEGVKLKPIVVRSAFERQGLSPKEIDEVVSRTLKDGMSLYVVDEELLRDLAPDLILTQDLCQVCAPSGNEVGRVIELLPKDPKVLWLSPNSLSDIFENIREVGEATKKKEEAERIISELHRRIKSVKDQIQSVKQRPRVSCLEWMSPPYNAGHWMPELVEMAGGYDGLGSKGQDSRRLAWEEVLEFAPEILILCPCGFDMKDVSRQANLLIQYKDWESLPAVKEGRVYGVDANSYFARPGPRIIEGLELLAFLIHPEEFRWTGASNAYRKIEL